MPYMEDMGYPFTETLIVSKTKEQIGKLFIRPYNHSIYSEQRKSERLERLRISSYNKLAKKIQDLYRVWLYRR